MTLYIVAKTFYNDLMERLDVVYNKPNLFTNAFNHVLFIKSNTLQLFMPKFYDFEIDKKYTDFKNFTFYVSKSYNDSISYILQNIEEGLYDSIKFIIPNVYPFRLQCALFHQKFGIDKSLIFYQNKFGDLSDTEIEDMFSMEKGYLNENENYLFEEIEKEIKLKMIDKIIGNFFMQKTTHKQNITLPYLFFDNYIKTDIKSFYIKKGINENGNTVYLYKILKSDGQNIKYVQNLYAFLDKFDDIYMDVNNSKYFDLNIEKILKLPEGEYFSKENFYSIDEVESSNKKLCELFNFYDYFNYEQMLYAIYDIEDALRVDFNDEILEYDSIPLKMNIKDFTDKVLNIADMEKALNEINTLFDRLKVSYEYKDKPIYKCPFCIDGYIYEGKNTYFCSKCDFIFYREKNAYNINITRRVFKVLLKNRRINLIYEGKLRTFILKKARKWYNLYILKE